MSPRFTYLSHLLVWTLPVIASQVGLIVWRHRGHLLPLLRALLLPVALVTVWLTLGDHFAIQAGVWRFGEGLHLGIYLGAVPLEEALFFLLTNVLVALGWTLFASQRRTAA